MKRLVTLLLLLFVIHSNQSIKAQETTHPWETLPQNINGWLPAEEDRIYHEDDLYNYIDGGAELFLSFGFKQVFNRIYTKEEQPDIYVDVFVMNSSYDAYGVFTLSTEKQNAQFGQGAQYTTGAVLFWKDNYFVSITTNPETQEAKDALFETAALIDKAIPGTGNLPTVVTCLPQQDLQPGSIKYFRHHHWQNSHLFLSYDNIFNISQTTHCATAKYGRAVLFVIEYPNTASAQNCLEKFCDGRYIISEDITTSGLKIMGRLLAVVFNEYDKNHTDSILECLDDKINSSNN